MLAADLSPCPAALRPIGEGRCDDDVVHQLLAIGIEGLMPRPKRIVGERCSNVFLGLCAVRCQVPIRVARRGLLACRWPYALAPATASSNYFFVFTAR